MGLTPESRHYTADELGQWSHERQYKELRIMLDNHLLTQEASTSHTGYRFFMDIICTSRQLTSTQKVELWDSMGNVLKEKFSWVQFRYHKTKDGSTIFSSPKGAAIIFDSHGRIYRTSIASLLSVAGASHLYDHWDNYPEDSGTFSTITVRISPSMTRVNP